MEATIVEARRLMASSVAKINALRHCRSGINLHKSLLVAGVLYKARVTIILESYSNSQQAASSESSLSASEELDSTESSQSSGNLPIPSLEVSASSSESSESSLSSTFDENPEKLVDSNEHDLPQLISDDKENVPTPVMISSNIELHDDSDDDNREGDRKRRHDNRPSVTHSCVKKWSLDGSGSDETGQGLRKRVKRERKSKNSKKRRQAANILNEHPCLEQDSLKLRTCSTLFPELDILGQAEEDHNSRSATYQHFSHQLPDVNASGLTGTKCLSGDITEPMEADLATEAHSRDIAEISQPLSDFHELLEHSTSVHNLQFGHTCPSTTACQGIGDPGCEDSGFSRSVTNTASSQVQGPVQAQGNNCLTSCCSNQLKDYSGYERLMFQPAIVLTV